MRDTITGITGGCRPCSLQYVQQASLIPRKLLREKMEVINRRRIANHGVRRDALVV